MQVKTTVTSRLQGDANYSQIWITDAAGVRRWPSKITDDLPSWGEL